jgi:hypothetical protein
MNKEQINDQFVLAKNEFPSMMNSLQENSTVGLSDLEQENISL